MRVTVDLTRPQAKCLLSMLFYIEEGLDAVYINRRVAERAVVAAQSALLKALGRSRVTDLGVMPKDEG